jgi:hypothetical protein
MNRCIQIKRISLRCVIALIIVSSFGCTAKRLAYDHKELREEVIMLYDEQIMDNLIRAYNGDVLLHLNYSGFAGESTTDADIAARYEGNRNESIGIVGASEPEIVALGTGEWFVSGGAKIHNKLCLTANPVDKRAARFVYGRYRKFARNPNFFVADSCKPEPAQVFKWREGIGWNDKTNSKTVMYYWVPGNKEARDAFYELVLDTSLVQVLTPEEETKTVKEVVTDSTTTEKTSVDKVTQKKETTKQTSTETKYTDQ